MKLVNFRVLKKIFNFVEKAFAFHFSSKALTFPKMTQNAKNVFLPAKVFLLLLYIYYC